MNMLKEIGIDIDDSKRKFISCASNFPIEVLYMRDDDIPQIVSAGTASLGIVGLNEVEERGAEGLKVIKKLGFGGCRISLAVPKSADYTGPQYFNGKRIATSYPRILKNYLDRNGIDAKIEVITGSVEVAPAAGIADAIFDIVSSGGTLIANGLKEVEKVFQSEAVLIGNDTIQGEDQEQLDEMLFRIDSAIYSKDKKYLLMNIPANALEKAAKILPSLRSPTIMPLSADGWYSMHSVVKTSEIWEKVRKLKQIGAEGILILNIDKIVL